MSPADFMSLNLRYKLLFQVSFVLRFMQTQLFCLI